MVNIFVYIPGDNDNTAYISDENENNPSGSKYYAGVINIFVYHLVMKIILHMYKIKTTIIHLDLNIMQG